jgi:hypothetical protein
MNAYQMLEAVREGIGEATANHWTDKELVRALSMAQQKVAVLVQEQNVEWLLKKSSSITPSSSALAMPDDCLKPVYLEEVSSGRNIPIRGAVSERRLTRIPGTTIYSGVVDAYVVGNSIEVNQDSYGEACYLWYVPRVIDLLAGTASAGEATGLTLESDSYFIPQDDYYNGTAFEVVGGTGIGNEDTISDFDGGTGVCVVTGTYDSDSIYGTVSILPRETHGLIVAEAVMRSLSKPGSSARRETWQFWHEERKDERALVMDFLSSRTVGNSRVRTTEMD